MNIGIDIDGVFINQEKFQLEKGIDFFKKQYIKNYYEEKNIKLKKSDIYVFDIANEDKDVINEKEHYIKIDSNGYGIKEIFDCDEEEEKKFWYKNMIKYALFAPFRKDSDRVAKLLKNEGNKLIAITARAKSDEDSLIGTIQRFLVKIRFKMHGIKCNKFVFCSYKGQKELDDKVNACNNNDIDIMIEDKKGNAEIIEKKTKAKSFLYATKNNADINNKNITRFVNFSEIYNGIKKYQEKEKFNVLHKDEKEKLSSLDRKNYYKAYREYQAKYVYDSEIIKKREKKLIRAIKYGKIIFDRFVKHEVINIGKIPKEDGVIITTNHRDMLDIPLVMSSIGPRPYHPMLKSEFLDTKAEGILTDLGFIFVNRQDKSIREQSRETATKRVLTGSNVIICPEGARNKTDKPLLDFDFGAVSIAQNSGKPIYPCAIYKSSNHKIVNFGDPIYVDADDELENKNELLYKTTISLLEECKKYYEAEITKTEVSENIVSENRDVKLLTKTDKIRY